ncbi:putative phosphoglycerate mutase [Arthrobacter silviterrae]|uniref:Histidine phosphatase family protein n=1 Tax=Arthrobacter silviterrae TaxID=2026658 RepID=A0ABX0D6F1_9MICC|nr:histidine phosphatase family protein [Arthrobacter silviterrae]MDQ0276376.1 putative phosphoglycerate mutase [Arthrobacter silviterrae]NGN82444.1 histidine phosphatase family protein [Arthrobacter silviterrae]
MTTTQAATTSVLQPAGSRRRVIFWRHGRTSWNAARRFQGQSDIPLDDVGVLQAARAASLLAGKLGGPGQMAAVRIISSDLSRARDTARALSALTGTPVTEDRRLRETFGGSWEGKTFEDIERGDPALIKLWQLDEPGVRAGGGETRVEVAERMVAAVLDAAATVPEGGTLVVATHGGATRVAMAKLLGLPEELWRVLSGLSNCHWSVLEQSPPSLAGAREWHWRLTEHNVGTLPEPYELPEDLAEPVED